MIRKCTAILPDGDEGVGHGDEAEDDGEVPLSKEADINGMLSLCCCIGTDA